MLMLYQIAASKEVLKDLNPRNMLHMTEQFGLDYWRRRKMLVMEGRHIIIRWPDEAKYEKYIEKEIIGEIEL